MTERTIAEHYLIQDKIGAGGMGIVYRGIDTRSDQSVAIKQLKTEMASEDLIERFRREGQALRELDHPNIVKVLDAVEEAGDNFLILEYVTGGDLNDLLERETLPVKQVVTMAMDLADALTRAHKLNIIHRDLKPANIMIADDGTLRLTDFGIAHIGNEQRVTAAGSIIGTLDYLPPEALRGDEIDTRADIWAFGVILFEMLTCNRPFTGENLSGVITAILNDPVPDLEELRDDVPLSLIDLIYRMLEKDLQARITSVRHIGAALEDILRGRDTALSYAGRSEDRFVTQTDDALLRPKHNLPVQATPFVGREAEIAEVTRLLADPQTRLITILGPGGMGKTRLSGEVALRNLERFSDGAYLAELAPLSDPASIVSTLGQALNYQFQQDSRDQKQQILDYLSSKQLLLIMDNFEHVVAGATLVTDILKHAPDVQILVTSRQKLGQSGETVFNLSGMDFPQWETPEDALEYAAVKLFMQSARRARPDFELQADDLNYVARICRLVHGVPLGILLAAAWLAMLSPEEIAEEIQQSLDFLEGDMGDMPDRHRSIRAVFDYSWDLMNEDERQVFMQLSVFRGGFTREAAQTVSGANLRTLMNLMNKSLLRREIDSGRYEIHELLRQYAEEQLQQFDQADQVYDQYSSYYLDYLQGRAAALKDKNQQAALLEVDTEIENIRAVWNRSVEAGDDEAIGKTLEPLAIYFQLRHTFQEGETLFGKAAQSFAPDNPRLAANLQAYQGSFAYHLAQYDRAQEIARESLSTLRGSNDDRKALAMALHVFGSTCYVLGDVDEGLKYLEESTAISDELGDLWSKARTLYDIVYAQSRKGDYAASAQARNERLEIAEQLDISSLKADALAEVGMAHLWAGDPETAKTYCEESLALSQKIKSQAGIAYAHYALGVLHWWEEDYEAAERVARKGYSLFSDLGVQWGLAWTQLVLGNALVELDRHDEGEAQLQQALTDVRAANNHFATAGVLVGLATLAYYREDYSQAWQTLYEALQTAHSSKSVPMTLSGVRVMALLDAVQDEKEQAVERFTLVLEHPVTMQIDWKKAKRSLAKLEEELSSEVFAAAQQRGKSADLNEVVQELLDANLSS